MYYVYEWFIVSTGEIIYVGKGTRNRYKVRKHNKFFNELIRREECDSRIVKEFETEKEAFDYEFERVFQLKAKGQCVCNIYSGGFGGTTNWWTDELKEKYSEYNVMKSEKQRARMSKQNPMKNPQVAEKASSKRKRAVIVDGVEYESVKRVCEEFHTSIATVENWCQRGYTRDNVPCRYKDSNALNRIEHINNGQARPVIYKGVRYNSSSDLARSLNLTQPTVSRWCRQHRDSYGNECRYEDDTSSYDCDIHRKSIPVIVNGTWYPCKEAASKAIGISSYLITQYLNGNKHSTEYICEYGNQQPSRGNVK